MSTALLRHTSNSLEDVEHWYVRRMFSWYFRHLERVYGEGSVTEAKKNKDTGKEMSRLISTEDKQGLVWGKSRPKILDGA